MKVMKRLVDRVLVIFPFEERSTASAGVPVQFVGHPLVDLARAQEPKKVSARDRPRTRPPIVALLPGSRPNEVERLLPIFRDAVADQRANARGAVRCRARASLDDRLFARAKWTGARPVEVLARTDDVLADF